MSIFAELGIASLYHSMKLSLSLLDSADSFVGFLCSFSLPLKSFRQVGISYPKQSMTRMVLLLVLMMMMMNGHAGPDNSTIGDTIK